MTNSNHRQAPHILVWIKCAAAENAPNSATGARPQGRGVRCSPRHKTCITPLPANQRNTTFMPRGPKTATPRYMQVNKCARRSAPLRQQTGARINEPTSTSLVDLKRKVGKQGESHITGTAPTRIMPDASARMGEPRAPPNSESAATCVVARCGAWLPR